MCLFKTNHGQVILLLKRRTPFLGIIPSLLILPLSSPGLRAACHTATLRQQGAKGKNAGWRMRRPVAPCQLLCMCWTTMDDPLNLISELLSLHLENGICKPTTRLLL